MADFPNAYLKVSVKYLWHHFASPIDIAILKLPAVGEKDKTRMIYPISLCVCVTFFFFSVSTCFSFGLVSGLLEIMTVLSITFLLSGPA